MDLLIYGAGGFGREVAWLASESARALASVPGSDPPQVRAFIDDARHDEQLNGIDVVSVAEAADRWPGAKVVAAIGSPESRERAIAQAESFGLKAAPPLIAPGVLSSQWNEIGDGSVVAAGSIITVNVVFGCHVQVNLDCTIGHDAILEDYVTLAPGVHVSGHVRIGRGAYIGTGANIINGSEESPLAIGSGSVVGAGACVIREVPANTTVVGVPATSR